MKRKGILNEFCCCGGRLKHLIVGLENDHHKGEICCEGDDILKVYE